MADVTDVFNPYGLGQELGQSLSSSADSTAQQGAQVTSDLAKRSAEAQQQAILQGAQQAADNVPAAAVKNMLPYLVIGGIALVIVFATRK